MKRFEVYKDMRRGAVIMGLPINLFALCSALLIFSLLILIFSFSAIVLLVLLGANMGLYVLLIRLAKNPRMFSFSNPYPSIISNKKTSQINYEED